MKVPFFKFVPAGHELDYVREVIESGWLTTAGKTQEFERRFAEAAGTKYACAVNSCTAALHLAAEAVGIGPGDEVIVPTMTFTATAEVIRYLGADPVFTDVSFPGALLTPALLREALDRHPRAKAVMAVHFGGHAVSLTGDEEGILDLCRQRGVKLIEDAAHAFPARWNGKPIGGFGDVTCFSFYANKTITTGEGGMLTTDDEALWRRVKTMRLHGINRDIWDRFTSDKPSWEYDVVAPGYKYNMPDINAAIGLAQLEHAESLRLSRQRAVEYYFAHLRDIDCLILPQPTVPHADHAWHLFPVILNENENLNRNELIEILAQQGIGTSVHYKPLHRMTYYREHYKLSPAQFPNAERIWQGTVSLPLYPSLGEGELASVVAAVRFALRR